MKRFPIHAALILIAGLAVTSARADTAAVVSLPPEETSIQPGEAEVQIPPRTSRRVRVRSGIVDRSRGRSTWWYYRAEAGGVGEWGQALLTVHREERGDTRDSALGLNTYFDLPGTGYGNARYALSPDHHFLPRHAVTLEYFQPFRTTLVASVNYRRRNYDDLDVEVGGGRLGKYHGHWFTRLSVDYVVPEGTSNGVNTTLMVRRYAGNPEGDYLQVYGSTGENVEPVVTGTTNRTFDATSLGLALRRHLGSGWGLAARLELAETDRLPTRRTVEAGLVWRW